jgi:cysteine-rich repeat protein
MASSTCRPWIARVTPRVVAIMVMLATVAQPRVAGAGINLTGNWYVTFNDFDSPTTWYFDQNGSSLEGTGGTGYIDSATGGFTMTFQAPPAICAALTEGTADAAGNTFLGTATITFTPADCDNCACSASTVLKIRGSRSPCGNGVVDAGEQCDDGNLGRNGDCCALGCTVRPDGASCSDDLFCNGQETTCLGGACQLGTPPCPFQCDETTDTCMRGCGSAPASCRTAQRSRLVVKNESDDGKDRLSWKWTLGESTSQAEFADPTNATDYALCIFSGHPPTLIGQGVVSADGSKWSIAGSTGFTYKDPAATAAGITKISLKGSTVNKSKLQVAGKGSALPDLPLPVTAPVTVQLVNETTEICWGASYAASELLKNQTDQLKAKSP